MQIHGLIIRNFRTLEELDLKFPSFYTAICGKNDAGKTNVVRTLRAFVNEDNPYFFRHDQDVSIKNDFPKWSEIDPESRRIEITVEMTVDRKADTGLYEFLVTHLSLDSQSPQITLSVSMIYGPTETAQEIVASVEGQEFKDLLAQEVLKKIQTSKTVLFYNSTELDPRMRLGRGISGFFRELSGEYSTEMRTIRDKLNARLKKVAKGHQKQLTELLGRLEDKYKPALSVPPYELDYLPFNLTLSHGKVDVALDDWGSGTRNRTLILLTLFRARQISESSTSASKVTPILVIEEPESFLHPAAQAELGRILQDLAEEFKVQVITTTHSPYLLSQEKPESNVLLDRRVYYHQLRETYRIDTSGERWMEPFGLALGIASDDFQPWRDLFFSRSDSILLVEGDIDKDYFSMLCDSGHGSEQMNFSGEIFSYGGKDTLKHTILLKFIRDRYKKIFVTFDLDAFGEVEKCLSGLGLERGKNYLPLGIDAPGKKDIEGLLPDSIKNAVRSANASLVDQAINGLGEERRHAKQRLKKLFLEEFKLQAKPGQGYFGEFYKISKIINKAFNQS